MDSRNIGSRLKILQLNVEGISRAKSDYLSHLLAELQIDVLMLQETHTETPEDLQARGRILGYVLIAAEYSRTHGIATYVTDSTANVDIVESSSNDGLYTCTIRMGNLHLTNVYKAPPTQWPPAVLKLFPHPFICLGDFNSHHQEWSYAENDENGELVMNWATTNSLCLVFDAKDDTTFFSQAHQSGSNPDLCFVSCDVEGDPLPTTRKVLMRFPNSQHRPILYEIGISIPMISSVQRPRWNFQKARWDPFKKHLDDVVRFIPPTCENYLRFTGLVIGIAKKHIPRGYRKEYIPCWNEESDRLYEEFRHTESPETAKELLKSLDEARRSKWKQTVESIDFSKSSRKSWALLRRLGGASKRGSNRPRIDPNLIAQRIVNCSNSPSDKAFSRKIRNQYRNLRRRTRRSSNISRAFTVDEIDRGIAEMKVGKAAGFDAMYPEFLVNSGARVRQWLANFFSDLISRNELPPIFKKTKIIAILKPSKPSDRPESYRPIALLSVCFKLLERLILHRISDNIHRIIPKEQAGFMKGRSCAEQVLSLTNYIENGFQERMKTGVVYVDLTAAYDTIWKRGLMYKLMKVVPCRKTCDFIMNMLSDRHFKVFLNDECSNVRKLNNGLPQGSVLSCVLFNLYIHDLPRSKSRKFLYADDMAFAYQNKKFERIEKILTEDLIPLVSYFNKWRLIPSTSKTVVNCYHLNHREANRQLQVEMNDTLLTHEAEPRYLGVILDRTLTYKQHLTNLSAKIRTRNNLIQKLANTSWGAQANCLRTSSLALVYSSAEYCSSTWLNSAHTKKIDTQLNSTMRIISGTVSSTPTRWLPALCDILPPDLRRKKALIREYDKIADNPQLPIHADMQQHPSHVRLKSRHPALDLAQELKQADFDPDSEWMSDWNLNGFQSPLFELCEDRKQELVMPRKAWCNLNRLRTGHGRCNQMLYKWKFKDDPSCPCGADFQTMKHIMNECPDLRFSGNTNQIKELSSEAMSWLKSLNL